LTAGEVEKVLGSNATPGEPTTLAGKIELLKRQEVSRALTNHAGNKTNAARALGMSRRGLCKVVDRMRGDA
jgi:transcriptional regulator with GAF, ATPase, and Fis domain